MARIARQIGPETSVVPGGPPALARPVPRCGSPASSSSAARGEVGTHIRRAREAGQSWHEIGGVLGFAASAVDGVGATVAEWAFDYPTGHRAANGLFDAPVFP